MRRKPLSSRLQH